MINNGHKRETGYFEKPAEKPGAKPLMVMISSAVK
jgi:hypothetical protein